ncbi:SCO family protein [Nocardioides mangrovicus]|uniref:SCO family protein n=1 Tax=Nocardioides mangrovicus TaxID=2478913 RepID=A0A3L8P4M8_9ACTN|nr:SCO family protein [Nocardioides mangrovicus]RLV49529.1 SCO family protein [Nocardioides mangrovicus]
MRRALVLLALLAALAGCGQRGGSDGALVSGVSNSGNDGYAGAKLDQPYTAPDVALTDTADQPYSLVKNGSGKLSVVFFGYSKCPDVCQVVMGSLASAYAKLDAADKARTQVVFVTTDPRRDTPAVLKTWLRRFDPAFIGLTGPLRTIEQVGDPLHVAIEKGQKLPSGGYDITHSTSVLALGGEGRVPLVWDGTTSPAQYARDIHRLLTKDHAAP